MEFSTLTKLFHSSLVPWLVVLSIATTSLNPAMASKRCNFPAIFNFGASNADTGGLAASFPFGAPKPPSGDTFFHRPAGRFCDGRLIIDFIGNVHYFLFHRVYVSNAAYFEVLHRARGIIVVCSVNVLIVLSQKNTQVAIFNVTIHSFFLYGFFLFHPFSLTIISSRMWQRLDALSIDLVCFRQTILGKVLR